MGWKTFACGVITSPWGREEESGGLRESERGEVGNKGSREGVKLGRQRRLLDAVVPRSFQLPPFVDMAQDFFQLSFPSLPGPLSPERSPSTHKLYRDAV
jgi:hypothetical protein